MHTMVINVWLFYNISIGVRQGGTHSPKLFSLYMNPLIDKLIACNFGYYINDKCINHIMYADDICLIAHITADMQYLLDMCHEYGKENDILFNTLKYNCIVFKPRRYHLYCPEILALR